MKQCVGPFLRRAQLMMFKQSCNTITIVVTIMSSNGLSSRKAQPKIGTHSKCSVVCTVHLHPAPSGNQQRCRQRAAGQHQNAAAPTLLQNCSSLLRRHSPHRRYRTASKTHSRDGEPRPKRRYSSARPTLLLIGRCRPDRCTMWINCTARADPRADPDRK